MKLKEGTKKWLMLVMLLVTNYANSEHFSRQERELLVAMTPKNFESELRENNDHIWKGRENTLQSRIRYAGDKFTSTAIKVPGQSLYQFTKRMDRYVARQNTAMMTREEYPQIFRNIHSVRTLNFNGNLRNNKILPDKNQRKEAFKKRHIGGIHQINCSLGKKSRQNELKRTRNIEEKIFERREQDRFCTRGIYQINKLLQTKAKLNDLRERNTRANNQISNSPIERKSIQFRERSAKDIYRSIYTTRKKTESVSEYVKRNTESSNTRERIVREIERNNFNEKFLFSNKMALNRNGKRFREDRTVHEEGERNTRFQRFTNNEDSRILKEGRITNNRIFMRTGRRLNEKSLDNRNHKTEKMQNLRSLNKDDKSSIGNEIREVGITKANIEDRNLNTNLKKIYTKESQTEERANPENKTFKPLFKNVETHEVSEERIRHERTARNAVKRSENKKQTRNSLVERTGKFKLYENNRKAMISKRVVFLRLSNIRSRDGKQEINDAGRNIQSTLTEATRFDRMLTTQTTKGIRESLFKERSAETITHKKIQEYERNNKVHKRISNARKQNVRDKIRSTRTFRFSESQEIIESKSTDYRVILRNEKLHNQNRISKTNFIEKRNKQPIKNVESIEIVRNFESRSTKGSGNRNMRKIDRDSRTILGENYDFRWKLVDNTRQSSVSDEIQGKISSQSVRNAVKRSVKDIKERMQVDQRNRKLKGKVEVLERHSANNRRILTTINSKSFSIRESKNRGARSNKHILVAGKKQERMAMLERNGRGFRGKMPDTGNPTRENENTLIQKNLKFRQRYMDFLQHFGIKNIQITHFRSIIKESNRRLQRKLRSLEMQPTEIKISPTNAESRKTNKLSNQSVSNSKRLLIKYRREGITRSITEQRNKRLEINEKYRKIDDILGHSSSNDEKWSRERSRIFERNDREFRNKMARLENQATETNRKRFRRSAVELYSINNVIIPNLKHSNIQKRNLSLFRKQDLAFNPTRSGRGFHGKIMKQELRTRKEERKTAAGESYSTRNARQIRKQMITESFPTAGKRFAQRMRTAMRRSSDSELTTREAKLFLNPTQQLKKSDVTAEPGLALFVSSALLGTHQKIETRQDISSYSRGNHVDNRLENCQRQSHKVHHLSRILHFITSSFKHEDDEVQNQKLVRNLPPSSLQSELNFLTVGSSRSVRNFQSSRKIGSFFSTEEFSKQANYGNGRSREMVFGSKMPGNIQILMHSALGSVSMSTSDIFQKYKSMPFQVHRTSEVVASSQNHWNIRGMNSTSFIFNALFGILILVAMSGDNWPKSRTFKERLFDFLLLRS